MGALAGRPTDATTFKRDAIDRAYDRASTLRRTQLDDTADCASAWAAAGIEALLATERAASPGAVAWLAAELAHEVAGLETLLGGTS